MHGWLPLAPKRVVQKFAILRQDGAAGGIIRRCRSVFSTPLPVVGFERDVPTSKLSVALVGVWGRPPRPTLERLGTAVD
jgi:hypothetical protein